MKRRVGKHYAQTAAETQVFQRIRILFGKQYNRPCRTCKDLFFFRCDPADVPDSFKRAAHKSKGLFCPVFPAAQPLYRMDIQRIAGQMNAADAFYRQNAAACQKPLGRTDGVIIVCGTVTLFHIKTRGAH